MEVTNTVAYYDMAKFTAIKVSLYMPPDLVASKHSNFYQGWTY
jgi:hypothetical protein